MEYQDSLKWLTTEQMGGPDGHLTHEMEDKYMLSKKSEFEVNEVEVGGGRMEKFQLAVYAAFCLFATVVVWWFGIAIPAGVSSTPMMIEGNVAIWLPMYSLLVGAVSFGCACEAIARMLFNFKTTLTGLGDSAWKLGMGLVTQFAIAIGAVAYLSERTPFPVESAPNGWSWLAMAVGVSSVMLVSPQRKLKTGLLD